MHVCGDLVVPDYLVAICRKWAWQSLIAALWTSFPLRLTHSACAAQLQSHHSKQHEGAAAAKDLLYAILVLHSTNLSCNIDAGHTVTQGRQSTYVPEMATAVQV